MDTDTNFAHGASSGAPVSLESVLLSMRARGDELGSLTEAISTITGILSEGKSEDERKIQHVVYADGNTLHFVFDNHRVIYIIGHGRVRLDASEIETSVVAKTFLLIRWLESSVYQAYLYWKFAGLNDYGAPFREYVRDCFSSQVIRWLTRIVPF